MTNDPAMSRRVTRLERILTEHSGRFDGIESSLVEVVRRLPEPS